MSDRHDREPVFVVPAQTLRGTREHMLADIDQAIMGLLALRHLVAGEPPALPATRAGSRTRLALRHLAGILQSFRIAT